MPFSKPLIENMCTCARSSDITIKLAAVILRGTTPVGPIMNNTERTSCHGKICPSLHAEANALMNLFGKSLRYSKGRWRVLCEKVCKQV